MVKLKSLSWPVLLLVVCSLGSPSPGRSQIMTSTITTGIPTPCIVTILKVGSPDLTNPTSYVYIDKILDTTRVCTFVTSNNADLCNPGSIAGATPTTKLIASAIGANINMMPSCQWTCAGCGLITTSAANDGLPVELMDFGIEGPEAEDSAGEDAESVEEREGH